MRHVELPAHRYAITFGDSVLDRQAKVGKRALQMAGERAEFFQVDQPIVQGLPLTNCFWVRHLVDGINSLLVPDFFKPTMCKRYVFL
jgi:hypothetical protein